PAREISDASVDFVELQEMENGMKHFLFHLMPYPKLPKDFAEKHESAWVLGAERLLNDYYGRKFARLIPEATLEVFPECGHLIPLEKPSEFHQAVTRFLG